VLLLVALVASLWALPATAGAATRRSPALAPSNTVVDGPSASILGLSGFAVARDGTGGVIYLRQIGGVAHVFVSELLGGTFQAPLQIDRGLSGPSSQPVIAATNGGLMVAAFINGGTLYAVQQTSALAGWQPPQALAAGAGSPSLSMSSFGKAYLAYTAAGTGGHDVRTAYYFQGQWAPGTAPLDANPGDDAGIGNGRPDVATAGDGTAIVVWGENGHVYARRVLGTSPSIVFEQADPPSVSGEKEVAAGDPQVSAGGDSSYAAVAFDEEVSSGSADQTRVLVNRLLASQFTGAVGADGLSTPGADSAGPPQVAVQEYGSGWVTSQQQSHNLFAIGLSNNDVPGAVGQLNSLAQQNDADPVPAVAGTISTLIAWQQNPGSVGTPEIRVRYAPNGSNLGPEEVVSAPGFGATDAGEGLFAGGDLAGDAAIAWIQGSGSQTRIMAAQLFQAPGGLRTLSSGRYVTTVNPLLKWTAAAERWGAPRYVVKINGAAIADTTATEALSPVALAQGRHTWQVTAVNLAGLTSSSKQATLFVDSLAPAVTLRVSGGRHVGSVMRAAVQATDAHRGVPHAADSGVSSVRLSWSRGSKASTITRGASHVYTKRGTYRVTVTATDRAGNRTVRTRKVKITPVPKHKKHKR
jgi:PKD domain